MTFKSSNKKYTLTLVSNTSRSYTSYQNSILSPLLIRDRTFEYEFTNNLFVKNAELRRIYLETGFKEEIKKSYFESKKNKAKILGKYLEKNKVYRDKEKICNE